MRKTGVAVLLVAAVLGPGAPVGAEQGAGVATGESYFFWAHWGGEPFDREQILYNFEVTGTTDAGGQGYSGPFHVSATFGSDGMSQHRAFLDARLWGENGLGNTIDGSCHDGTTNDQRTVDEAHTVVSLSCTASIDGRDTAPITLSTVTQGVFVGNPGVPCVWGICVGPLWYTTRHAGVFTSN